MEKPETLEIEQTVKKAVASCWCPVGAVKMGPGRAPRDHVVQLSRLFIRELYTGLHRPCPVKAKA